MKKQLTVNIPNGNGEEGLTQACRRGELFRGDRQLEVLYKEGYRIYNYSVLDNKNQANNTQVEVFLRK